MSTANYDKKVKSFAYHAQALGLSASLTRPCCENIPSLGTASLSMTGGESYSTVRNYNWKGLISFDEASAYATGSMGQSSYDTLSTVTVRNLNFANMVHADLLVARVTSKHVPGNPEGDITFSGSTIQGLVVAGRPVHLEFDHRLFSDNPTYADFSRKVLAEQTGSTHSQENATSGLLSSSLVAKVDGANGYKIAIPEFGTIYVAQVLMKTSYRRISMLRFELGCPIKGTGEVAAGESNGVEYWPT